MSTVRVISGTRPEMVLRDTWGHLDAQPGVRHPGSIVFAEGQFGGDKIVIQSEFGDHAGFGPWFYEGIHDWLYKQPTEPGGLYRFDGYYRLNRSGGHEFVGEVRPIALAVIAAGIGQCTS